MSLRRTEKGTNVFFPGMANSETTRINGALVHKTRAIGQGKKNRRVRYLSQDDDIVVKHAKIVKITDAVQGDSKAGSLTTYRNVCRKRTSIGCRMPQPSVASAETFPIKNWTRADYFQNYSIT
ncbi:hypothetical protein EDEG_02227 [Edhazardia aedis USNM 41457]|uniref:Uncharacterized protein n=1 Tax=Edhazardia aedis (strain USNM 41457) TaxID=1003232 RepID=J9DQ31_EDHAE|nr:hypothetical protein EDEG_02227 [Edhazardia aedis USNM 41457]|eukprot:EJW03462.1 hypothetical protein EDEG_02227 [Edhazardia aedis USNM 41457]